MEKQITGRVIRELDADILCLVEVDDMAILERFNASYLAKLEYRYRILIDGTDPRNHANPPRPVASETEP